MVLERFALLFCIGIVWAFAAILTVAGAYNNVSPLTKQSCRTDRAFLMSTAPWYLQRQYSYVCFMALQFNFILCLMFYRVKIPYPFQWGTPIFRASHVFGMMGAALVSSVEVQQLYLISRLIWKLILSFPQFVITLEVSCFLKRTKSLAEFSTHDVDSRIKNTILETSCLHPCSQREHFLLHHGLQVPQPLLHMSSAAVSACRSYFGSLQYYFSCLFSFKFIHNLPGSICNEVVLFYHLHNCCPLAGYWYAAWRNFWFCCWYHCIRVSTRTFFICTVIHLSLL